MNCPYFVTNGPLKVVYCPDYPKYLRANLLNLKCWLTKLNSCLQLVYFQMKGISELVPNILAVKF